MKSPKTMIDSLGREIPISYVSKYDRENDRIVRRIHARHAKARKMLEAVMLEQLADFDALRDLRDREGRRVQGEKGNLSSRSFDGTIEVKCSCRYELQPDDRLSAARDRMVAWVTGRVKATDEKLAAVVMPLIEEAFRANASGGLSMARVASLLRVEIKDPEWLAARQMMLDSLTATKGKQYLEVFEQPSRQHPPRRIRLDFADCWPNIPSEEANCKEQSL